VGWFWFLAALVPVIGLVQVGMQARADRYTYIPQIGLALIVSWGMADLAQMWPQARAALIGVASLALSCCLAVSAAQVKYWQNNQTLYDHALQVTPDNFLAHDNLGIWLAMEGKLDEALKHFQEAIRLNPGSASAYDNMGKTQALEHRPEEAIADWREAVRLAPRDPKCLNNLAWIYATCPKPNLRNSAEAVRLASLACEITQRQDPSVLDTLAAAYAEAGRFDEAIKTTREIQAQAVSSHDTGMVEMARQRLELYNAGKPYRDAE
jgi:tetratricopeptide (TPR) repeat protein